MTEGQSRRQIFRRDRHSGMLFVMVLSCDNVSAFPLCHSSRLSWNANILPMPSYKSFRASIIVDGKPLDEYRPEQSEKHGLTTVTCWVPSVAGKVNFLQILVLRHIRRAS